jgi:hypothetical protein
MGTGMGTNFYPQPLCWRTGNCSTRPVAIPNENEDYMPQDKNDNEVQEVAQQTEYDIPDEENEVFINIIRDNIANVLVSGE